jgi:hypothetical protein
MALLSEDTLTSRDSAAREKLFNLETRANA